MVEKFRRRIEACPRLDPAPVPVPVPVPGVGLLQNDDRYLRPLHTGAREPLGRSQNRQK